MSFYIFTSLSTTLAYFILSFVFYTSSFQLTDYDLYIARYNHSFR
jgi:hypothetical protein